MEATLAQKIEALVFYRAEPVEKKELAKICGVSTEAVSEVLAELGEKYKESGIALVDDGVSVSLATAPAVADFLQKIIVEERAQPLSKATSEVLSTILYMDKPSRSEIDFVRGVNSSFSLRTLLVRGLVEKMPHPSDARKLVYIPTVALLSHLGVGSVEALPNFESTRASLSAELARTTEDADK